MSFRNSSELRRSLVISKYNEFKANSSSASPSKIYNFLRFNGHPSIGYQFVYRTINRYEKTNSVSDKPRDVQKRKIDESVKNSVIQHATDKKKPKYLRSTRKTAEIQSKKVFKCSFENEIHSNNVQI